MRCEGFVSILLMLTTGCCLAAGVALWFDQVKPATDYNDGLEALSCRIVTTEPALIPCPVRTDLSSCGCGFTLTCESIVALGPSNTTTVCCTENRCSESRYQRGYWPASLSWSQCAALVLEVDLGGGSTVTVNETCPHGGDDTRCMMELDSEFEPGPRECFRTREGTIVWSERSYVPARTGAIVLWVITFVAFVSFIALISRPHRQDPR